MILKSQESLTVDDVAQLVLDEYATHSAGVKSTIETLQKFNWMIEESTRTTRAGIAESYIRRRFPSVEIEWRPWEEASSRFVFFADEKNLRLLYVKLPMTPVDGMVPVYKKIFYRSFPTFPVQVALEEMRSGVEEVLAE